MATEISYSELIDKSILGAVTADLSKAYESITLG